MNDIAAKNLEQQLMATSKHGTRLTCPGCGAYIALNTITFAADNPRMHFKI